MLHKNCIAFIEHINPTKVTLFESYGNEPPTSSVRQFLKKKKIKTYLPFMKKNKSLKWFEDLDEIPTKNTKAFKNDIGSGGFVSINEVLACDIFFIPCMAVDKNGNRLGKGGGCYDRLLQKITNAPTVALVHKNHVLEKIPTESHDQKITHYISQKEIFDINSMQPVALNTY